MTSEIGKFVETLVEDGQKDLVSSVEDTNLGIINNKEECGVPLLSNIKDITKDLLVIESEKSNTATQELVTQSSLAKTIKPMNIHCSTGNDRKNIEFSNSDIVINNGNTQECTMSNVDPTVENNDNQTGSVKQYDADIDNQLPETVTLLRTPDGGKLYLVGTAHFSIESQNDVSKIIQAVQPHIVVVELCRARVGILQLDEQVMYRYAKDLNFQCIQGTFKEYGLYNGVLNILLFKMIAHITKELGMAPGGEFRRAFEEAKKVPYCMLHMGDRPINITIQRALQFLSWWQTIKLAWHLIMIRDPISKEDVELCKQRAFLDDMLAKMSVEFPVLGEVFVKERDIYLTYSLQLACLPQCTSNGLEPARVVGVVGLGHIPGIVENWCKVKPSDIPPIMSIPPLSLSTKVLQFTFKASLVSAIIYIGYKIIPLASIKSSVQGLLKMELSEKVLQSLTNTQNVNILPEESFMQILEAVICHLCKTSTDSKGLCNIKVDSSKSDIVKSTFANLSCLFIEAAKHDFDKENLEKFLNAIPIVGSRVDTLCYNYERNKQEIQMQLQLIGNNLPHIVDTDWRLSHCMKYGFQSSVGSFQYHVRFTIKEYAETKYITFTCTLQQLQELLCKVKDAARHLERFPSN